MIRYVNEDTQFTAADGSSHLIRKGDRVAMYPPAIHKDPEIFEDPEVNMWKTYHFTRKKNSVEIVFFSKIDVAFNLHDVLQIQNIQILITSLDLCVLNVSVSLFSVIIKW